MYVKTTQCSSGINIYVLLFLLNWNLWNIKWNLSVNVCYLLHIVIIIQTTYIQKIRKHIQPYTKLII